MLAGTVWLMLDRSSNAAPFQDVACLSPKSLDPANRRAQGHNNCHRHDHGAAGLSWTEQKRRVELPICSPGKNGNVEHPFHHPDRCVIFMPGTRPGDFNKFLPKIWNRTAIRYAAPHPKRHARGLMRQPRASERLVGIEQPDPRHFDPRGLSSKGLAWLGYFPDPSLDVAQVIVMTGPQPAFLGPLLFLACLLFVAPLRFLARLRSLAPLLFVAPLRFVARLRSLAPLLPVAPLLVVGPLRFFGPLLFVGPLRRLGPLPASFSFALILRSPRIALQIAIARFGEGVFCRRPLTRGRLFGCGDGLGGGCRDGLRGGRRRWRGLFCLDGLCRRLRLGGRLRRWLRRCRLLASFGNGG
jgi:hypothetical protein